MGASVALPTKGAVSSLYGVRVGAIALGVALSVLSARLLGPEGQGNFASLKTSVLLGSQIMNVGLSSALTILFARRPNRISTYRSALILWPLAVGVVLVAALVTLNASGLATGGHALWPLAVLWIPIQIYTLHVSSGYLALQSVRGLGAMEAGGRALALAFGTGALTLFVGRVDLFAGALVLADAAAVATAAALLPRATVSRKHGPRRIPAFLGSALRLGLRAYPVLLIPFLLIRSDVLLVRVLRGAREAGIYSIAGQVIDISLVLPTTITALVLPSLVRSARPEDGVRAAFRPTALVLVGLAAAVALFGQIGVRLLFGPAYASAYAALLLLLPGFICLGLESLLAQYFAARGYPPFLTLAWLGAFALNLALNLYFVPRHGFLAAAASSSVCYGVIFCALLVRFRRETTWGLTDLLRGPAGKLA
jgi:O-antigen/teichoic acid export membrane protein